MARISVNPVRTNFNIVAIGDRDFYFSYRTLVAIRGTFNNQYIRLRTSTHHSVTTERHMGQSHCKTWDEVPQEELEAIATI